MNRAEFEKLVAVAANVTGDDEMVVIGSQRAVNDEQRRRGW